MTEKGPLRIGVLGGARIVEEALLAPARGLPGVEVVAVAAREADRAAAFAQRHGIPRTHASYEALLADTTIEAVYLPLPAALHARWMLAAISAGKHVLCEKPFTASEAGARRVADAARGGELVVMEAYHSRFHPLHDRLRAIIASGEIGAPVSARADFCIPLPPGEDIRWNPALGGGGLLDVGYYAVRVLTELFGDSPQVERARAWQRGGVDRRLETDLRWPSGVTGSVVSSLWSRTVFSMGLVIEGEEGGIRVAAPYHPHKGGRIRVRSATGTRTERTHRRSTYSFQLEAFRDAIRSGMPVPTDAHAAAAHLATLDAIYRAAGMAPRVDVD